MLGGKKAVRVGVNVGNDVQIVIWEGKNIDTFTVGNGNKENQILINNID